MVHVWDSRTQRVFTEVEPEDLSRRTPITSISEAEGGAQVLREELEEAKAQQEALQSEATSLQEALRGGRRESRSCGGLTACSYPSLTQL